MKNNFKDKTVLIFGLGRFGGGVDSARYTAEQGARVIVTDSLPADKLAAPLAQLADLPGIVYHLGGHDPSDFRSADVVIVNPAVPPTHELLKLADRPGQTITSQVGIFFSQCPAPIVGITGSNGKSTTTALTAHLLRSGLGRPGFPYRQIWLGGNIGNQPLLCILKDITPDDIVVLELSSFQLEQLAWQRLSPIAAALTNLAPNHLDRHGTMEAYADAKENIFRFQPGTPQKPALAIFNAEDSWGRALYQKYCQNSSKVCRFFQSLEIPVSLTRVFGLPGGANAQNLAAAWSLASWFGVKNEWMAQDLPHFKGLPHRLEFVREIAGVRWYNDSIATTPESVIVALDAFTQPRILIAGGYDKHLPFNDLGRHMATKAKAVVLIGATASNIRQAILTAGGPDSMVQMADSMASAVQKAASLAQKGDMVLMSPACASYDMFENFQHRAQVFCDLVRAL